MSVFNLSFKTDNAAFDDAPASEIGRILRDVADKVEQGERFDGLIRDLNGNRIGAWDSNGR